MGYLVAGHLLQEQPDLHALRAWGDNRQWTLYQHRHHPFWLLDVFRQPAAKHSPFTEAPSQGDSQELATAAPAYAALVDLLAAHRLDPTGYGCVLQARHLSEALAAPVFTFAADDDTLQLTTSCDRGRIIRIHQIFEGLDAVLENGQLTVQSLQYEDEGPDTHLQPEFFDRLAATPGIRLAPPRLLTNTASRLHDIILQDWPRGTPVTPESLGIGNFDDAFASLDKDFTIVAHQLASSPISTLPSSPQAKPKSLWQRLFGT